jgi:putative flippase GtrA
MISRELFWQLVVFGIVGLAATATHYVVAVGVHELAHLSPYYSNILGYCSAVMISFYGHGKLTFKVRTGKAVFARFVGVSLTILGLSELLLMSMHSLFELPTRISMLVVVLTVPIVTYTLNKVWVFRTA